MSSLAIEQDELDRRLTAHLRYRLGQWPPTEALTIVGSHRRVEPGWDGRIQPVVGVATPEGTVLSVPPEFEGKLQTIVHRGGADTVLDGAIGDLMDFPRHQLSKGVFRFSRAVVDTDDAGEWLSRGDARVPPWLTPFNGDVLVALSPDNRYMAGVGLKRHDDFGIELAVGTEPAFRNQGLARRLVAQASRQILSEGKVAIYLHRPDNFASAAVAEATGFPDLGWSVLGLGPPSAER